jgi:hypothetical protein
LRGERSSLEERRFEDAFGGADSRIIGVKVADIARAPQGILERHFENAIGALRDRGR